MLEMRSCDGGFAQGELFGAPAVQGVGARQAKGRPPGGGGGYLKICGPQNFRIPDDPPPDPRFSELEKIGLPGAWLRLARRIGFDAFLDVWRMISEDDTIRHDGGHRMPKLREYDAYLRFQRNEYVRSLAQARMNPKQVQRLIRQNLREHISIEHVQVLMKTKVKSAPAQRLRDGEHVKGDNLRAGIDGASGG